MPKTISRNIAALIAAECFLVTALFPSAAFSQTGHSPDTSLRPANAVAREMNAELGSELVSIGASAKDGGRSFPSLRMQAGPLKQERQIYRDHLEEALTKAGLFLEDALPLANSLVRYKENDTLRRFEEEWVLPEGMARHLEMETMPSRKELVRIVGSFRHLKRIYRQKRLPMKGKTLLYKLVPLSWIEGLVRSYQHKGVTFADVWYLAVRKPDNVAASLRQAVREADRLYEKYKRRGVSRSDTWRFSKEYKEPEKTLQKALAKSVRFYRQFQPQGVSRAEVWYFTVHHRRGTESVIQTFLLTSERLYQKYKNRGVTRPVTRLFAREYARPERPLRRALARAERLYQTYKHKGVSRADAWHYSWSNPNNPESALRKALSEAKSRNVPLSRLYTKPTSTAADGGRRETRRRVETIQGRFRQKKEELLRRYRASSGGLDFADAYASLIAETVKDISDTHLRGIPGVAVLATGSVARRNVNALSDLDLIILREDSLDRQVFRSAQSRIVKDLKVTGFNVELLQGDTVQEMIALIHLGNPVYAAEAKDAVFIAGGNMLFEQFKRKTKPHLEKIETVGSNFIYNFLHRKHSFQSHDIPDTPNLKYFPGGQRTFYTLYWVFTHLYGLNGIPIRDVLSEAAERNYISPREKETLLDTHNFFLFLENEIGRLGRKDPVLSRDIRLRLVQNNPALQNEKEILTLFTKKAMGVMKIWRRVTADAYRELKRKRGKVWARTMDEALSPHLSDARRRELFLSSNDDGIRYALLIETTDPALLREASKSERWPILAAVSSNPHTPKDVLSRLGRKIVAGFEDVNLFVARNPNTPRVTLQWMAKNPRMELAIQIAAKASLKTREKAPDGGRRAAVPQAFPRSLPAYPSTQNYP